MILWTRAQSIVLVVLCTACGARPASTEAPPPETAPEAAPIQARRGPLDVGEPAPEWSLDDATGTRRALGALRGAGPVVIVFYQGSWCSTCREALGRFQERAAGFVEAGATLVAISADPPEKSKRLGETLTLTYPLLSDPKLEAIQGFGVVQAVGGLALSAVFVIDKDGVIRWTQVGEAVPPDRVLDAARGLTAPAPAPAPAP